MSEKESGAVPIKDPKPSSIIREYRIVLPMTVEEYHIGQLYGVAEASKNETGGGEGIEIIENRQITENDEYFIQTGNLGQYTHKRFHLYTKVPSIIRLLAPDGSLEVDEKAWNCYPYCRTEYSNRYMGECFHIIIETRHETGNGDIKNVHNLTQQELNKRTVDFIDISKDEYGERARKQQQQQQQQPGEQEDPSINEDPSKFKSTVTGRGPLVGNWQDNPPQMCCYKLYRVLFKWKLLQNKVENLIMKSVRKLLFNFHSQVFCWIDKWHGLTIEDIRKIEDKTKEELKEMMHKGSVKGMKATDEK